MFIFETSFLTGLFCGSEFHLRNVPGVTTATSHDMRVVALSERDIQPGGCHSKQIKRSRMPGFCNGRKRGSAPTTELPLTEAGGVGSVTRA